MKEIDHIEITFVRTGLDIRIVYKDGSVEQELK